MGRRAVQEKDRENQTGNDLQNKTLWAEPDALIMLCVLCVCVCVCVCVCACACFETGEYRSL